MIFSNRSGPLVRVVSRIILVRITMLHSLFLQIVEHDNEGFAALISALQKVKNAREY